MIYKTLEGVLSPDGHVSLPPGGAPSAFSPRDGHNIGEQRRGCALSEVGDYLDRLKDYEEQLARGEIQWQ